MSTKRKKIQLIHVTMDMYPEGVVVLQESPDVKEFSRALGKGFMLKDSELAQYEKDYEETSKGARGFVITMPDTYGRWLMVIFVSDKYWLETLAHECSHVADHLCVYRGVGVSPATNEVRAMMVGWVFSKVQKVCQN